MKKLQLLILGSLLLLAACATGPTAVAPTPLPEQIASRDTATPLPTLAPPTLPPTTAATATDIPTATATAVPPSPTSPPTATATATATATPTATASPTAVPPTAVPASPTASAISLADLPNYNGQEVTVNGRVIATASFSHGFRFILDDGQGQATLLMWHNVYDDAWDAPKLNIGAAVRASGEVGQYEGEWQIVPDFGGDVKVTEPGGSFAPVRAIGELGNHMGELAQVSGVIVRLESSSSNVRIFLADDSGEILVLLWRNVLDRIPNNVALGEPGTRLRVTGRVDTFRSNRQLVPALPYDVELLP